MGRLKNPGVYYFVGMYLGIAVLTYLMFHGQVSIAVVPSEPARAVQQWPGATTPVTAQAVNVVEAKKTLASVLDAVNQDNDQFLVPNPAAFIAPAPEVHAKAALVKELSSPYVYVDMSSTLRWPLASLTKVMTATVALEILGGSAQVAMTPEAVASEGAVGDFAVGEVFTVSDLVRAMLTVSSNDAATALGDALGGEAGVQAMRRKALTLGMSDTFFADTTGLSPLNQSTARDFEKLVSYVYKNLPEVFAASTHPTVVLTEQKTGKQRTLTSINQFAGRSDFLGGKTGYTDEANGNLVSLFHFGGRTFLFEIFGTSNRFGETSHLIDWLRSVIQ